LVVSAAPAHAPSDAARVTFQLCTNRDISTWLQQLLGRRRCDLSKESSANRTRMTE
jgi:hypothetical protein